VAINQTTTAFICDWLQPVSPLHTNAIVEDSGMAGRTAFTGGSKSCDLMTTQGFLLTHCTMGIYPSTSGCKAHESWESWKLSRILKM
jgi:hypothetical protein